MNKEKKVTFNWKLEMNLSGTKHRVDNSYARCQLATAWQCPWFSHTQLKIASIHPEGVLLKISNYWELYLTAHSSWKQSAIILPKLDTRIKFATSFGTLSPVLYNRKRTLNFELGHFRFLKNNVIADRIPTKAYY